MSYLLIQNKGIAPVESYTLLGASLSRDDDGLIGQFGSGAKLAITTLLRAGKKVIVYCGKTRLEFRVKTIEISDGIETKQQEQVYIQFSGTSTKKLDLGWTLGFGTLDWKCDINMAIREFIANAIDHTVKQGANIRDAYMDRDLAVEIVADNSVRAQDGYTRIFIEACDECQTYVNELSRRFLHFGKLPLGNKFMNKVNPDNKKAQVYMNGVFVCELSDSADSLFDYCFTKDEIKIDEARNLSEYSVRAAIGKLFRQASVEILVTVFRALDRGVACLETGLDCYYLKPDYYGATPQQKENWKEAWTRVHGENTVACGSDNGVVGMFAHRKGYNVTVMHSSGWMDTVKEYGVPTVTDVLDSNERKGRTLTAPTFEAIDAVNTVWGWITATDLIDTEKCPKPHVRGFDEIADAESDCLGFYNPGGTEVFIRNDVGGQMLLEVALEEISHYCSGATDCSRDFQSFLMRLLVRWLA